MWYSLWRPERKLYYSFVVPGIAASTGAGTALSLPIGLGGTLATYTSSDLSTSHTMSVTVPATGVNRKLIIFAGSEVGGGATHTGMTYNDVAMTAGPTLSAFTQTRVSMWYMDDAALPDDGLAHDAILSTGTSCSVLMACAGTYVNVAQGAPSATGSDSDTTGDLLSIALTSVSEGALVVDGLVNSTNSRFTPGGAQVERFDFGGTVHVAGIAGSDVIGAAAGTVTMTQDPVTGAPDVSHIAAWWGPAV